MPQLQGTIDLGQHKAVPVSTLSEEERKSIPIINDHGQVDIQPILDLFASAPKELWNEEFQMKDNTHMIRPAHDKWGIGKIVLTFCDDYFSRRYEFPWYEHWKAAIEPIYRGAGIDPKRVVRCLFAKMPAGAFIKPHHDTGLWVSKTHRVHVPIVTNEGVKFLCGMDDGSLQRYPFPAGQLIELNNAAKHSVHNESDTYRIHMIFDYVDTDDQVPETVVLAKGSKLYQSRRSVDVAGAPIKYPLPAFMVAGSEASDAPGSPVRSVFQLLAQHPLIVKPLSDLKKSPDLGAFLDRNWNKKGANCGALSWKKFSSSPSEYKVSYDDKGINRHALRKQFNSNFDVVNLRVRPSLLCGERGSSYLRLGALAAARLRVLSASSRPVLVVSDPVRRARRHVQAWVQLGGALEEVERLVLEDIGRVSKAGLQASHSPVEQAAAYQLYLAELGGACWASTLGSLADTGFAGAGLYAAQLQGWRGHFPNPQVTVVQWEAVAAAAPAQDLMNQMSSVLGLPGSQEVDYGKLVEEAQEAPALSDKVEGILRDFYAPFNDALYTMLPEAVAVRW